MEAHEQTGEKFDLKKYFEARNLCKKVVSRIASKVSDGITENDGQELIKNEFKKEGVEKFWHPSKFRIGSDTTKSFRELPDRSLQLFAGDVFFLDVGPIIEEHEADYGETFIFGKPRPSGAALSALAEASAKIWRETANQWKESHFSGKRLLDHASNYAQTLGYELNPLMAGHRLGDFPHALFSKEKLFSLNFAPAKNLWVLEIHIVSHSLQRGAFFED